MHLNAPTYGEQAMKPEEPFIKVEHLTKIFHPAKKRSLGLPGRKNGPLASSPSMMFPSR